jgi:hypothetical protein
MMLGRSPVRMLSHERMRGLWHAALPRSTARGLHDRQEGHALFAFGAAQVAGSYTMARNGTKERPRQAEGIPLFALALAFALLAAAAAVLPQIF